MSNSVVKIMTNIRLLNKDEINEGKRVFSNTIDYNKVYIQEYGNGAMTWAYSHFPLDWYYIIFWSSDVYKHGALYNNYVKRTLIHELTHVWQGHNGYFTREYMIKSGVAQTKGVFKDAWEKGFKELAKRIWEKGVEDAWHSYRERAYVFSMNEMGVNNFKDFNTEQQASIVESWYAPDSQPNYLKEVIPGGNMSIMDVRYPYITCNILANSVYAQYTPLNNPAIAKHKLGKGWDAKIKAIQDILVKQGYLDAKYADGYMGKNTREAVRKYQKANNLKVDGNIGGTNSETRKKLGIR